MATCWLEETVSRMPAKFATPELVKVLRAQGQDAFSKHYSLGMWSICVQAADEIDRLCGLLRANGIDPGFEFICKCGLRRDAPQGEMDF